MKNISAELQVHLAGDVTTLATCWKLTRQDGVVMGFTDHGEDISFESVVYVAASGFAASAVESTADLAVDNMDVSGVLDSNAITEADILAGLYDRAAVEVFMLNYTDISQGVLLLRSGTLGEVTCDHGRFVAEIRGLTQHLRQTIGQVYSPGCRAELGDSACGVALAGYTEAGAVTSVTSRRVFQDSALLQESGYFDQGKVTFTSGANEGLAMEVSVFTEGGAVKLVLPMPYDVEVGDTFSIQAGCDKSFATCISRFANAVNFRGEPHVPGTDRLLETAGTYSDGGA